MTTTRRVFIVTAALGSAVIHATVHAQAALDEKDPQAQALGYVADASRVDARKNSKYAPGQNCAGCTLYQGKAGDAAGGCPLYPGKHVSAKGWCTAWVKKT